MSTAVTQVFGPEVLLLSLDSIIPIKEISPAVRYTRKYQQILASLKHLGLIEPFVVYPTKGEKYWLLDGNLRLDALRQMNVTEVRCIVATDDESYTYNKKVNYLPPIAENYMILKAIKNGVSEERIAAALSVVAQFEKLGIERDMDSRRRQLPSHNPMIGSPGSRMVDTRDFGR